MNEGTASKTVTVSDETSRHQGIASNPAYSIWVSANAGSGKTHVLTQRVIRLMLAGTRPASILCLTYTKAAASEMSNRVFERLSRWTSLDDAMLAEEIAKMEGEKPGVFKLQEARKLFARALESPGGLKIQTIHAFCEALLHQFPLEANVAGHFSTLDDKGAAALLAEARRNLLTETGEHGNPATIRAVHEILAIADESGLNRLLGDIILNRTAISRFMEHGRKRGDYRQVLAENLGLGPKPSAAEIAGRTWPLPQLRESDITRYIDLANSKGGTKVHNTSYNLALALREEDPVERLFHLKNAFLRKNDELPFADASFFSKAMSVADQAMCDIVRNAASRVAETWQSFKTYRMFEASVHALTLAERLIENYEQLKKERSFLDFEDFITRTEALLKKDEIGPWVHYKLDQGIDHILVDEAQDTSPSQWEIIRSLTSEFFSGESARAVHRTIFAVGDEKQSIYSFQGAQPEKFAEERKEAQARAEHGNKLFHPINLRVSFRSTEDVLSAVDQVFADPGNARGLSAEDEPVVHVSNRVGQAGAVDIWETIAEERDPSEDEDWLAPFDKVAEKSAAAELARRVALAIDDMVGRVFITERSGKERPIAPGDILVLVRKRDAFAQTLARELKRLDRVPVAGADRLVLASHIAVQDLLALARFALLPEDDLSLANLIKSPIFDMGEEELFELCTSREENESVWRNLNELATKHEKWRSLQAKLNNWRRQALSLRPFEFFSQILGKDRLRARFLGRFGSEVGDVLDEFLAFALAHEQAGLPGLASFVATLETDSPEIKREQDKGRNEVRIMTVHASKGLEAPIVFLVDGGSKSFDKTMVSKLRLVEPATPSIKLPVWYPSKEFANPVIAVDDTRREEAANEEYRRLLYVGMTRASDRLILCSFRKKQENAGTWAKITQQALAQAEGQCSPAVFKAGELEWNGWKWRLGDRVEALSEKKVAISEDTRTADIPEHLFKPLPPQKDLPRPLAPSGAHVFIDNNHGDQIIRSSLFRNRDNGPAFSQIRGKVIHRLLQKLPDYPAPERYERAMSYLERAMPSHGPAQRREIARPVLDLLENPNLAFLHASGTQAEVSIAGEIEIRGVKYAISGRIDRLGKMEGQGVFIFDYKTNLVPPASRDQIPNSHIAQLALYREVLRSIFRQETVHCLLLYTEGPQLYTLEEAELEKALLDIGGR